MLEWKNLSMEKSIEFLTNTTTHLSIHLSGAPIGVLTIVVDVDPSRSQSPRPRLPIVRLEGQRHGPFLHKPGPNRPHALQQLCELLVRIDVCWMQANAEVPDTVLKTHIIVLAEEIVDHFPASQRSAGHESVKGTDFDFFEVRRSHGEQCVPIWIVWLEVTQEVDRQGLELRALREGDEF